MSSLSKANDRPALPPFLKFDIDHFRIPLNGIGDKITTVVEEILESSMNPASAKYMGHMDSIPALWSIVGDFIASAMNNNMLSLEMSPYLTQLEYALISQFADFFGLPKNAGGVMLSGGTLSNLQALTVARNVKLGLENGNVAGLKKQPVIFCSEYAHASLFKAGMVLGFGLENVIRVKTDAASRMDIDDLKKNISVCLAEGKFPFAIVATAGTTITGSIDPLEDLVLVARRYNLWLHVDAIYGGALIFSEKHRDRLNGIQKADSISFNPQKWMFVAKTCSMVLFADKNAMISAMQISSPYMKDQTDFRNLGEISVQGTRHADVLKLYLTMLSFGRNGFSAMIAHSFAVKENFLVLIASRKYLEVCTTGDTNIICFRIAVHSPAEGDRIMEKLYDILLSKGYFLSLPIYKGRSWLRCVLLNPFLTESTLVSLFEHIDAFYSTAVSNTKGY